MTTQAYFTQEFHNAIQELRHDTYGRPIRKPGDLAIACMPDGSTAAVELIERSPSFYEWHVRLLEDVSVKEVDKRSWGWPGPIADDEMVIGEGWLFDWHHEVVGD